jgi:hypothetical protein
MYECIKRPTFILILKKKMRFILIILFFCFVHSVLSQQKTGELLIEKMWNEFHKKTPASFSFRQRTNVYRADTLFGSSLWYERICYPDKFRIDIDSFPGKKIIIFRDDSSFFYVGNELKRVGNEPNALLLILGGMYHRELSDVKKRLILEGYDLQAAIVDTNFKGRNCRIIGGRYGAKQIWVGKDDFRICRMLEMKNQVILSEMKVCSWVKHKGFFVENKIEFFTDGKLIQQEVYEQLKFNEKIRAEVFLLPK